MAGYFRKLVGRVYDGSHVANANIKNGTFAGLNDSNKVIALAAKDTGTVLRCVEKTDLWGLNALVLDVVDVGAEAYMVENDFPVAENGEYDETTFEVKAGEYVKMKRLLPGEQIVVSVDSTLYGAANEGSTYNLDVGGGLVAVSTTPSGGGSD